jgi:hypothetical protein
LSIFIDGCARPIVTLHCENSSVLSIDDIYLADIGNWCNYIVFAATLLFCCRAASRAPVTPFWLPHYIPPMNGFGLALQLPCQVDTMSSGIGVLTVV